MKSLLLVAVSATWLLVSVEAGGCWRPIYGRGVGKVITTCPDDLEEDTGLCYTKCNDGFYGVGPVCWANCPDGMTVSDFMIAAPDISKPSLFFRTWESVASSQLHMVEVWDTGPKRDVRKTKTPPVKNGVSASGTPNVKKGSTTFCVASVHLTVQAVILPL